MPAARFLHVISRVGIIIGYGVGGESGVMVDDKCGILITKARRPRNLLTCSCSEVEGILEDKVESFENG